MLKHMTTKNQLPSEIYATFTELKIAKFLKSAGICKNKGFSALLVFTFLFSMIFKNRSMHQIVSGREAEKYFKKDTVYRFMNQEKNNWRKFLLNLSTFVISKIHKLTDTKTHIRALVLDDSSYYRNKSKKVTNLGWQFDHAENHGYKGFRMLTLGFTDGFSFIPIDFSLLSSKHKVNKEEKTTDLRTAGGKRFSEASKTSPELAETMIKRALNNGIYASHVLMDRWFTKPVFIDAVTALGIDVIGMVCNGPTRYFYKNRLYNLKELYKKSTIENSTEAIISSIYIKLQSGKAVKVVFVRNRNKQSEWLALMTTDTALSSQEIVKIYGTRWQIETFFKATKSLLKLAKETQSRNYEAIICHTTVVFVRYITLSWQNRCANDDRTLGGMFYDLCDQLQELDWSIALVELTKILVAVAEKSSKKIEKFITCQLQQWIGALPSYIKAYLPILVCES